jgi:predicted  nucleic acid-binding Zn-ribbon protein
MGISDRLGQLLPGNRQAEDERLLNLYWNRAELKKELTRLQQEHHELLDEIKKYEGLLTRAQDRLQELQDYLGDPEVAMHALAYFQLRSLWQTGANRVARFAEQLGKQQEDRERRRQLIEFDQTRRRQLAEFDRAIAQARSEADSLEAQLKLGESELASLTGFWNYFRRKRVAEEIQEIRNRWDVAATRVTDLSDDRAGIEEQQPPAFRDLSVDGKRVVNTAVIAYAQQLVSLLSAGGLAMLAKETTARSVFEMRYGTREECVRLMALLREARALTNRESDDLAGLKERIDLLRASAAYSGDEDTIPLTDSIGTLAPPSKPVSGLESINKAGVNVLVDDYWDVYSALLK